MDLLKKIISLSSAQEPFAGGNDNFAEQIKASLPFLQLIPEEKKKVLVVGCGDGYEVKWLVDHGFSSVGVTKNRQEIKLGKKKYGMDLQFSDMHQLPFANNYFDCLYAANILEHSVAPYIALLEWRRVLKKNGWLMVVMPSQEWLAEYYHYSVLTHSQVKNLLHKSGFELLAGSGIKAKIAFGRGDVFYDLGRGWGHYDGYVASKKNQPREKFMLGKINRENCRADNILVQLLKLTLKKPYNFLRVWFTRHCHA